MSTSRRSPPGRSARRSALSGKGQSFQRVDVRACGFCILTPTPLASAGVLAPSFCIPRAYCFSNELFTLVSSSLAAVWAGTGTDMLARHGAVRWARAGCWGKRLRGDEMSSLHLWSDTETSLSEKVGCLFKTGKGGKGSLPGCRGLLGGRLIGSTGWPHPGSPADPKQDLVPSSLVWCSVLTSWVESSTDAVSP